eukprot:Hpha_TRINITY_DN16332_c3_g7::TRINITY_DN16332_c3_g7_i1::g.60943::m.60943/K07126/K07126; uncharacterized protein
MHALAWQAAKMSARGCVLLAFVFAATAERELAELEADAAGGDHEAALEAAEHHIRGREFSEAERFLRLAADGSSGKTKGSALHLLGSMFQDGLGREQDTLAALHLWREAALVGDVKSQANLGMAFLQGMAGVTQSAEEAAFWFRSAALQGDAVAQFNVAMMLSEGTAVPRDERGSIMFLRAAAEAGHLQAQAALGERLSQSRRKAVQKKGRGLVRKAADKGDPGACMTMGKQLLDAGEEEEAAGWYRKAAEKGDAEGQFMLGSMYSSDTGVEHDDEVAAQWFRAAARQGHAVASHNLANLIFNKGIGGASKSGSESKKREQDRAEAVQLWQQAVAGGIPDAAFLLGLMYKKGQGGLVIDDEEAVKLFKAAASTGHENALRSLQGMGEKGTASAAKALAELFVSGAPGIAPDEELAASWASRARKA